MTSPERSIRVGRCQRYLTGYLRGIARLMKRALRTAADQLVGRQGQRSGICNRRVKEARQIKSNRLLPGAFAASDVPLEPRLMRLPGKPARGRE